MPITKSSQFHLTVVWFKRDLRLSDHAALVSAASAGKVLLIYLVEPDYWKLPDISYRQWEFLRVAVGELHSKVENLGGKLCIYIGKIEDALENIHAVHGHFKLVSHMETGNAWTYRRDVSVAGWCGAKQIEFKEFQQYGVWRGTDLNRDKWAKSWDAMMLEPVREVPTGIEWVDHGTSVLPSANDLGLDHDGIRHLQPPGRTAGFNKLNEFLY